MNQNNPEFPHTAFVLIRYELSERISDGRAKPGNIGTMSFAINGNTQAEVQTKLQKLMETINEFKQNNNIGLPPVVEN